jgi:hypothetical protein
MDFKITATLHATTLERWICQVQQEFLDDVPENLKWPRLRVHDEGKNVNQ